MSKRGFTIIELLGVISVIAVMAAILFPVYARAKAVTRRQICVSNLFNMGMALRMYAVDNDGYYPPRDDDLGPLHPQYVGDKSVFMCPDGYRGRVPMGAPADESLPIDSHRYGSPYPGMIPPPKESEDKAEPEEEPITWSYYYRAGHRHNELPVVPLVTDSGLRHQEKANVMFSDGGLGLLGEQDWRALGFRPLEEIIAERNPPPGMMGPPPGYPPGMPPPVRPPPRESPR
ncbi:MAG: type II secretion system protein [Armatimonadetes bacterium]|nr:type II secretion system protein [Armatimonadota bacterium]